VKDEHVKNGHVKGAVQGVAEGVTLGAAEDVLGAAEDESVKVLIVARAIFQRRNPRPTHAFRPPRCPWATREGRARHVKDAAQNDAGDVPQDAAQDLAFGADSRKAAGE